MFDPDDDHAQPNDADLMKPVEAVAPPPTASMRAESEAGPGVPAVAQTPAKVEDITGDLMAPPPSSRRRKKPAMNRTVSSPALLSPTKRQNAGLGALPGLPPAVEAAPAPAFFMPTMPAAEDAAATEPAVPVIFNPPAFAEQQQGSPPSVEATPERGSVPFVPLVAPGTADVKEKKKKKKKTTAPSDTGAEGTAAKKPKKQKKEASAGDASAAAPVGSRALNRELKSSKGSGTGEKKTKKKKKKPKVPDDAK